MSALLGPVLTNARDLPAFLAYQRAGKFTTAKVIAGWGLDTGWTDDNRRQLVQAVPELVVRTSKTGDPSNRGGTLWHLHPDQTADEVRPWVRHNPRLWIELGNEPDVQWELQADKSDFPVWVYQWWLDATITRLRAEFPQARLIAPSPRVGTPRWERWLEIRTEVLRRCDAVSLHIYGWHRLIGDGKGEWAAAQSVYQRLFPTTPIAITELGVNDPATAPAVKMQMYREFAAGLPGNYPLVHFFHLNTRRDIFPEYHIPLEALK